MKSLLHKRNLPPQVKRQEDDALANIQEAIELYFEPPEDEIQPEPGIIVREPVV